MSKRSLMFVGLLLALLMLAGCGGEKPAEIVGGDASSAEEGTSAGEEDSSEEGTPSGGDASLEGDASAGAGQTGGERSRIVNIGSNTTPTTLDPHNFRVWGDEMVIRFCYETLIYSDRAGKPYRPMLATSWDIAPDHKSWTFHLREGVFWNNGDPFTADDVVYSVRRVIDGRDELLFLNQYMPELESAEKLDDCTVKINLNRANPLAGNGFRAFYIIPQKAHEEYGDDLFFDLHMIGTAPWKMLEWIDGQYVHWEKNENYWNKENFDSYFDEVYMRVVMEPSSGIFAHTAGTIDAFLAGGGISPDQRTLYDGTEDRIELVRADGNGSLWFGLQFEEGSIWHDINVRKAFDMALDRQTIRDRILQGGTVPTGYFHSTMQGYDESLGQPVYDLEQARQLLAESSYDGRPFEMMCLRSMTAGEEMALFIQDQVNSIGFNMEVSFQETSVFTARLNAGDYDIFFNNTSFPDGIPKRQMDRILNNTDKSGYVNEEMNENIRNFSIELDDAARIENARRVNQMIFELKAPHINLLFRPITQAINYGLTGIELFPDGVFSFVYIDYDPSLLPE